MLMNGETLTYKDSAATTFEMQDRGLFFIHSDISKDLATVGKKVNKVHYRYVRTWIPYQQIKYVEILTNKEMTDPKEIEKYQKFLEHGMDIMMTRISNTVPKTPEQVQDEIDGKTEKPADIKPAEPVPAKEETPPTPAPEPAKS